MAGGAEMWAAPSDLDEMTGERSMPTGSYGGNERLPVFLAGVQEEGEK